MKAPKVFAVVFAAHLAVISLLLFQQGCQTVPPEERAERTQPLSPDRVSQREAVEPEAEREAAPQRAAPRRPDASMAPATDDPGFETGEDTLITPEPRDLPEWENDWDDWEEDTVVVPEPEDTVETGTYTVQSGDSLYAIAQRESVAMDELLSLNNLTRDSVIHPGQELRVPARSGAPAPRPETAAPDPVSVEGGETYTVQSGDTLSGIASRHGTTVSEIRAANNLQGDMIRVGQELVMPESGAPDTEASPAPEPEVDGIRHTVRSGETPGGIAGMYGVSVAELMEANNITDARRVRAGQELIIPGTEEEEEGAAEEDAAEPEESPAPADGPLPVVPQVEDEPEEMQFMEDEEEEDDDVPVIQIIPDEE